MSETPKAYVWAMCHMSPTLEEHNSLAEAVEMSLWAADRGEESLLCIEVPSEGRVYSAEEVQALWRPLEAEQAAERKALPRNVALVEVQTPDLKRWAVVRGYPTREATDLFADGLRGAFGDRVRVRDIRR